MRTLLLVAAAGAALFLVAGAATAQTDIPAQNLPPLPPDENPANPVPPTGDAFADATVGAGFTFAEDREDAAYAVAAGTHADAEATQDAMVVSTNAAKNGAVTDATTFQGAVTTALTAPDTGTADVVGDAAVAFQSSTDTRANLFVTETQTALSGAGVDQAALTLFAGQERDLTLAFAATQQASAFGFATATRTGALAVADGQADATFAAAGTTVDAGIGIATLGFDTARTQATSTATGALTAVGNEVDPTLDEADGVRTTALTAVGGVPGQVTTAATTNLALARGAAEDQVEIVTGTDVFTAGAAVTAAAAGAPGTVATTAAGAQTTASSTVAANIGTVDTARGTVLAAPGTVLGTARGALP